MNEVTVIDPEGTETLYRSVVETIHKSELSENVIRSRLYRRRTRPIQTGPNKGYIIKYTNEPQVFIDDFPLRSMRQQLLSLKSKRARLLEATELVDDAIQSVTTKLRDRLSEYIDLVEGKEQ